MSRFRKLLGKVMIFVFLEMGAVVGLPVTPEEIEKLLNVMNRTKVVHILRTENDKDPETR